MSHDTWQQVFAMGCRRYKESYYEAISKEQVALANKEDAQVFSTTQRIFGRIGRRSADRERDG
jgi:hypothetical protein